MIDFSMEITQQAPESVTIQLTESQGAKIREFIMQNHHSFPEYVRSVGIQTSNAYAYLSGQKRITLKILQKLLSGTDVKIQCNLDIFLEKRPGDSVPDADFTSLEDSLSFDDLEE